jgi:hypothetical protein
MAKAEGGCFAGIVSATRLHLPLEKTEIPAETQVHLRNYVLAAQKLGVVAAIAVNSHGAAVERIVAEAAPGFKVHVLHVPCWGAFVPALNTLLGFAQRCGKKYILFQSLEVTCTSRVLERLLDHMTKDTLVVGPAMAGHTFQDGEQPLNGRTVPWNTLALWSVRKLTLTGFPNIADGFTGGGSPGGLSDPIVPSAGPMGSDSWWVEEEPFPIDNSMGRQVSASVTGIPAGVEEVTAIALLQHLLSGYHARAVLLQLPAEFDSEVSWKTSWGQDEARKKWHEYKMMSKVSRPAAQLQYLFPAVQRPSKDSTLSEGTGAEDANGPSLSTKKCGVVTHFSTSIRPAWRVERICVV